MGNGGGRGRALGGSPHRLTTGTMPDADNRDNCFVFKQLVDHAVIAAHDLTHPGQLRSLQNLTEARQLGQPVAHGQDRLANPHCGRRIVGGDVSDDSLKVAQSAGCPDNFCRHDAMRRRASPCGTPCPWRISSRPFSTAAINCTRSARSGHVTLSGMARMVSMACSLTDMGATMSNVGIRASPHFHSRSAPRLRRFSTKRGWARLIISALRTTDWPGMDAATMVRATAARIT